MILLLNSTKSNNELFREQVRYFEEDSFFPAFLYWDPISVIHKIRSNISQVPEFCKVEGRTAEDWMALKDAGQPQPGEPRQPMSVERYTTIFCAKAHNLDKIGRRRGAPGGRRGRGRGGRGKGGRKGGRRGEGGRRRGRPSDAQEVPPEH